MWTLNSILFNNQWSRNQKGNQKLLETNENVIYKNLGDVAKAPLRVNYIERERERDLNDLTIRLKELDKEGNPQLKASRRKQIVMKINTRISEMEN